MVKEEARTDLATEHQRDVSCLQTPQDLHRHRARGEDSSSSYYSSDKHQTLLRGASIVQDQTSNGRGLDEEKETVSI